MTGVSTLGQALAQINNIKDQQALISRFSTQLTTGKKTQKFTGLGSDVLTSQRSRAAVQALETYRNNITNASRRVELMLSAVQEFQAQAKNFLISIGNLSQESVHQDGEIVYYDDPLTPNVDENTQVGMTSAQSSNDLNAVIDGASDIYNVITSLLNAKDGNRYLLSGAETRSQPISDTGTLTAAIGSLITDWKSGGITTTELIADLSDRTTDTNTNAITDSVIGYSLELSAGNVGDIFVRVDDGLDLEYTALANADPFRDILVAVSYLKDSNLPPIADAYIPPNSPSIPFSPDVEGAPGATLDEQKNNFFAVINALVTSVNKAVDDIDLIAFKLSNVQAQMTRAEQRHLAEEGLLQDVIGDVENIDENEVALKLTTIIRQLEASYAVTARVQQLSLVNFI